MRVLMAASVAAAFLREAPKPLAPEDFTPKHGDWMHNYNGDSYANCLVRHSCKSEYDPVCAGETTFDNECHAKCKGAITFAMGECGGCVEPKMCCQEQQGGVTKEIEWEKSGEVKVHTVCVPSKGKRCAHGQTCDVPHSLAVVGEAGLPRSTMTPPQSS